MRVSVCVRRVQCAFHNDGRAAKEILQKGSKAVNRPEGLWPVEAE